VATSVPNIPDSAVESGYISCMWRGLVRGRGAMTAWRHEEEGYACGEGSCLEKRQWHRGKAWPWVSGAEGEARATTNTT
jgi:hypothetical protein